MKTSLQGIVSILADEAIVLSAYNDGVGIMTIGAGHTAMAGSPKPKQGMKISLIEAINIFRQDLRKFERDVVEAIDVPISQHQFDALVSWHFNTGSVRTATLTKLLNAGDVAGAAKQFARWNKANGRVLRGLSRRRQHETAIFTNADYGDRKVAVFKHKGASPENYTAEQIAELFQMKPSVSEEELSTEQLLKNPNSKLLPRFRPQQSEQVTRATIANFAHLLPENRASDPVKILAVRGYYSNTLGEKGKNDRNLYDDAIFVVEPAGVHAFNGNTDPSGRRTGLASLSAPQAVRYVPGLHGYSRRNGPYPAFRQNSECTVLRDRKGEDTGIFWINIHRGGNKTTSSAGCQTVPPHQWNEFKTLVDNLLQEHDQATFYYILVDQLDVASEDMIAMPQPTPDQTGQQAAGQGENRETHPASDAQITEQGLNSDRAAVINIQGNVWDGVALDVGVTQSIKAVARVGTGGNVPGAANPIYFFELPPIMSGEKLTSANLRFNYDRQTNHPEFNADLYGLGWISGPPVLNPVWYWAESNDDVRTGKDLDTNIGAAQVRKLQNNILTSTSAGAAASTPTGTVRTDAAGDDALLGFVQSLYAAGARPGDFAVLRMNPDANLAEKVPFAAIWSTWQTIQPIDRYSRSALPLIGPLRIS